MFLDFFYGFVSEASFICSWQSELPEVFLIHTYFILPIMPTYEYVCDGCTHEFEVFQSMKDDRLKTCPECNEDLLRRKIGTGAGIIFKGTGFYETDYKRDKKSGEKKESGSSESSSKSESTSSTSSSDSSSSSSSSGKSESSTSTSSSSSKKSDS